MLLYAGSGNAPTSHLVVPSGAALTPLRVTAGPNCPGKPLSVTYLFNVRRQPRRNPASSSTCRDILQ